MYIINNRKNREYKLFSDMMNNNTQDTGICYYCSHTKFSNYPPDKIPLHMVLLYPDEPNSPILRSCLDCRNNRAVRYKEIASEKIKLAQSSDMMYCSGCNMVKYLTDMSINKIDNNYMKTCKSCKESSIISANKRRGAYNLIKLEYIKKYGCSCQACKSIFIKHNDTTTFVRFRELKTFMDSDNKLAVIYENKLYETSEFIKKYEDRLELRIIQLDHLTEEEQRIRGLLKENEQYRQKKNDVSQMGGEISMRLEASKCQHLCRRCHIKITNTRQKKNSKNHYSSLSMQKKIYVDKQKIQIGGCQLCGYWDSDLLKFFDFDHIDIFEKTATIASMVILKEYTLNDVKKELKNCRLLCGHCHILHTCYQAKLGLFEQVKIHRSNKMNNKSKI